MATLQKTQKVKCPQCKEEVAVQVWSCGCQLVPEARHCEGTRSFKEEQAMNCGEQGHPKGHNRPRVSIGVIGSR